MKVKHGGEMVRQFGAVLQGALSILEGRKQYFEFESHFLIWDVVSN
jgi:hypothetical protein